MIGLVFCNDLNVCPYIYKYLSVLDKAGVPYEIVLWNRKGDHREYPANYRVYNQKSDEYVAKWKKLGAFIGYRNFIRKTIKQQKYDKLIMLSTLPAVLCYGLLCNRYAGKYIFDFRDLGYEKYGFYKKIVQKLIKNSAFTSISSPGFAKELGLQEYVMAHNFRYEDVEKALPDREPLQQPINLLHIGITRGEAYNKKLADIFGNDPRFVVNIIGSGNDTKTFLEYTKDLENIHVAGTYNNTEKAKYIKDAAMLLYYYPCSYNCNRALANKYYDGMIFKKPLIGNVNTYSGQRLQEKGLGIALDIDDPAFADKLFEYITHLETAQFMQAVETELAAVLEEDKLYLEKIQQFVQV